MRGDHFTRKDSFVDQHGWPIFWHFPMCIVWRTICSPMGQKVMNEGWSLHKERFLCWPTWWPIFWHFPMCIVWRGLRRIIVYLNYLFTCGSKSNEWGWLSLQKEKFLCWSFSWHFPVCIVLWGLPRIIVYFKLYCIWVSSLIKVFF